MTYHSPLGHNFKLEASISAAKELQAKETHKSESALLSGSRLNKSQFEGRRSENRYSSSPGWQRPNWKSPNSRRSLHNESVSISNYYHPSMLEDPWKELEEEEPS